MKLHALGRIWGSIQYGGLQERLLVVDGGRELSSSQKGNEPNKGKYD
jgi:hypothetical protein